MNGERRFSKTVLLWVITLSVPMLFVLVAVWGYYGYKKLTFPAEFCGSFAQPDSDVGWVLQPNAESCYGMKDPEESSRWAFRSRIFTDRNGFRSAKPGAKTPTGAVLAIGDSWTFGYGVDHAESYPGWLSALGDAPVVNVSSPAYSATQALVLAERWVDTLEPTALIYLDLGFWERGACRGETKPTWLLKPCYWVDPATGETISVTPPKGLVARAAALGVLPGGMLGAGEDGWNYFLISRPATKVLGLLARIGIIGGMAHDFRADGVDRRAIRAGVVRHLQRLSATAKAPLVFLDPLDRYADFDGAFAANDAAPIIRVGKRDWERHVIAPARSLPAPERHVPVDGHFGPGMNRLIAKLVIQVLEKRPGRIDRNPAIETGG